MVNFLRYCQYVPQLIFVFYLILDKYGTRMHSVQVFHVWFSILPNVSLMLMSGMILKGRMLRMNNRWSILQRL